MSAILTAPRVLIGLQFGVLVLAGVVGYALNINNAISWLAWLLAGAISLIVLGRNGSIISPGLVTVSLPFIVILMMNVVMFGDALALALPVVRYFVILYIVALALASIRAESLVDMVSRLDIILWLQLVALIAQHILVIPRSGNWDSAVGTFGGNPFGGGNSSGLGLYLCLMLAWALVRYRNDIISGKRALAQVVGVIVCGALAETKTFVLVAPVVAVIAYRAEVRRSPLKFLAILAGAFGLLLLLAYLYWKVFYSGFISSVEGFVSYIAPELMGEEILVAKTGEVGRIEALRYWWRQNAGDYTALLLGQGILSTQSSGFLGLGQVQIFQLGNTTASAILWEAGALGFLLYLLPFSVASIVAWTKLSRATSKQRTALLEMCVVAFFAWLPFLFQSLTQYQTPQSQWLGALILAAGFAQWRESASEKSQ